MHEGVDSKQAIEQFCAAFGAIERGRRFCEVLPQFGVGGALAKSAEMELRVRHCQQVCISMAEQRQVADGTKVEETHARIAIGPEQGLEHASAHCRPDGGGFSFSLGVAAITRLQKPAAGPEACRKHFDRRLGTRATDCEAPHEQSGGEHA